MAESVALFLLVRQKNGMPNNRRGFGRMAGDTLTQSTEKLSNGSFETSGLSGWTKGAGITATQISTAGLFIDGSKSERFEWSNVDDGVTQNITTFTVGATYMLSGYVYVLEGVAIIGVFDASIGAVGDMIAAEIFTRSSQFEPFSVIFQATSTASVITIGAFYDFTDIYVDGLSLKRMN